MDRWGAANLDKSWEKMGMNSSSGRKQRRKLKWIWLGMIYRKDLPGLKGITPAAACRNPFSPGWYLQLGLKVPFDPGLKLAVPVWRP